MTPKPKTPALAPARWSLDGAWTLRHGLEGPANPRDPAGLARSRLASLEARVPGNVELDLQRAGRLADPLVRSHIEALREYEFHQWWYERDFRTPRRAPGSGLDLVFEGLDCFATVWVNGREVGRAANALIAHRFDVTAALKPAGRSNRLTVRLASPVNAVRDHALTPHDFAQTQSYDSLWARKPAHCYGWDIMPRAVSAGLWRPVYLEERRATEWVDAYVQTGWANEGGASLVVAYQFRTDAPLLDGFAVRITGRCGDSRFEQTSPAPFVAGQFHVHVAQPRLWWPRGYGAADLYDVRIELLRHGQPVSALDRRVGIRTLELDRTDLTATDSPGRFVFKINGTRIFVKGSNWVPADAFHSRDAERIPGILELVADLGCNMLRCWGGNVYEPHLFYDLCDREGILVWQDFAMACALYPQEVAFQEALRQEAEAVVRELRQHVSIALWAGDNECDCAYSWGGLRLDPSQNRLTREVLPHVLQRLDPARPYLPSSPYLAPAVCARGSDVNLAPEQHLWGPRDYYKGRFYTENTAAFASEIGYHGCPNVSSIRRFISPEHLWPWQDNREWQVHATDPVIGVSHMGYRVPLMAQQVGELFGDIPGNLEDFALASQVSQAEAKKFFVEMFRLRKWRTSGILWWNVMDGWPQFSDAIVDYYFSRKLAYWYLRRVQRPLCVLVGEPDNWHVPVVVGNDSRQPRQGTFRIRDADSDQTLLEGRFQVPANENASLGRIHVSRGQQRLFLIEWDGDGEHGANHYLLGTPPFALDDYKRWLGRLAALDGAFDAATAGR